MYRVLYQLGYNIQWSLSHTIANRIVSNYLLIIAWTVHNNYLLLLNRMWPKHIHTHTDVCMRANTFSDYANCSSVQCHHIYKLQTTVNSRIVMLTVLCQNKNATTRHGVLFRIRKDNGSSFNICKRTPTINIIHTYKHISNRHFTKKISKQTA